MSEDSQAGMSNDKIPTHRPFFDQDDLDALGKVLDGRWLGMGAIVSQFETAVSRNTQRAALF